MHRLSRADAKTELDHIYVKQEEGEEDSEEISSGQSIPLYQLTRLPSDAVLFRKPKNVATSSRNFDRQEEESSRYVVLMPDKIKDVCPYQMLKVKNPERSSSVSSWLDRYLPRRITNAMIRYFNDISDELDYEDSLDTLSGSAEEIDSDEEVSYSLNSDESNEKKRRKIFRNVADEVDHESRKEDQQQRMNSKESHEHLKMKGRMQSEKRQTFMPLPVENEKTKRQRRQAEINKVKSSRRLSNEILDNAGSKLEYFHTFSSSRYLPILYIFEIL